jgi:hypothetical protein
MVFDRFAEVYTAFLSRAAKQSAEDVRRNKYGQSSAPSL